MSDTILGVIIGGIIGIISAGVSSFVNYIVHSRNIKEQYTKEYRNRKVEAYQLLLEKINKIEDMKEAKDFDFYYSKVLPFTSDDIRLLIDEFYLIFFEPQVYLSKRRKKINIESEKGKILGQINELIRTEIQQLFHSKKKIKIIARMGYWF